MHKILLITIILLLSACTSTIRFGVSQKYILNKKNEVNAERSKKVIKKYEYVLNPDTLNFPLNKYIDGNHYKVYIGASINLEIKEVFKEYKKRIANRLAQKQTDNSLTFLFEKNKLYYCTHIYHSKRDKITYILTLESDSTATQYVFDKDVLAKKIKTK